MYQQHISITSKEPYHAIHSKNDAWYWFWCNNTPCSYSKSVWIINVSSFNIAVHSRAKTLSRSLSTYFADHRQKRTCSSNLASRATNYTKINKKIYIMLLIPRSAYDWFARISLWVDKDNNGGCGGSSDSQAPISFFDKKKK